MNINLLGNEVQDYIRANTGADVAELMLRGIEFDGVTAAEVAGQIESRKKLAPKAPVFTSTPNVYMPPKLAVEQATSQLLAEFKANLVSGLTAIDLTGGMGVDTYFLSQQLPHTVYCEINPELAQITKHNLTQLNANVQVITGNGMDYLNQCTTHFDVAYIDPARRGGQGQKVFLLEQCKPNILEYWQLLQAKAKTIMVKLSPIIDIAYLINQLPGISDVYVLAEKNEVKEVLILASKKEIDTVKIHSVSLAKERPIVQFTYSYNSPVNSNIQALSTTAYLYLPAAPLLKANAQDYLAKQLNLNKLHANTHIYWSETKLENYFGRVLKIEGCTKIDKKALNAMLPSKKANVLSKNFPMKPSDIVKKFKLKEGGKKYLIATSIEGLGNRFLVATSLGS